MSSSGRNSRKIALCSLAFVAVAVLLVGGREWWRRVALARVRTQLVMGLSKAFKAPVKISDVSVSGSRRIVLTQVTIGSPEDRMRTSASVARVVVTLRPRSPWWRRRQGPPSVEAVHIGHATVRLRAEQPQWQEWVRALLREWRSRRALPLRCDVVMPQGKFLWLDKGKWRAGLVESARLSAAHGRRVPFSMALSDEKAQGQRLTIEGAFDRDGTRAEARIRISRLAAGFLAATAPAQPGVINGSLGFSSQDLLVEHPRVPFNSNLEAAGCTVPRLFGLELGPVTGKIRATGAIVLGSPPRLVWTGTFHGASERVPALTVHADWQSAPAKWKADVVATGLDLRSWLSRRTAAKAPAVRSGHAKVSARLTQVGKGRPQLSSAAVRFSKVTVVGRGWRTPIGALSGDVSIEKKGQGYVACLRFNRRAPWFSSARFRFRTTARRATRLDVDFTHADLGRWLWELGALKTRATFSASATGRLSLVLLAGNKVATNSLRGVLDLRGINITSKRCPRPITAASGHVTVSGSRTVFHEAAATFGDSPIRVTGWIDWRPPATMDLRFASSDLLPKDLRALFARRANPRDLANLAAGRCSLHFTGQAAAPQLSGLVECFSLPIGQQTIGETFTTSVTFVIAPSPAAHPKVHILRNQVRMDVVPGFKRLWDVFSGKPSVGPNRGR